MLTDGHPVKYLDVGGGLGIDYYHGTDLEDDRKTPLSTTSELIRYLASEIPPDVNLIIEPGRSLMATSGS